MNWRELREQFRGRLVDKYAADEAKNYDTLVGSLSDDDELAYLADIQDAVLFSPGLKVLDVGAGTGALTKILLRVPGIHVTAMEPSSAMCELLHAKPSLEHVKVIRRGCDSLEDRDVIAPQSVDVIVSRQVVNSLFDPLVAFQNWMHWLKVGGHVVVIDGIYGRDGWSGVWAEEVDVLPLSACQSLATLPYLLESVGFRVETVQWMARTNGLAATRTKRYIAVALKTQDSAMSRAIAR